MGLDVIERDAVAGLVPQRPPFRFLDEIVFVDDNAIVGTYRFRRDEFFYRGHFPGNPVTPGVILLEAMAQIGSVAHGIYFLLKGGMTPEEVKRNSFLFALADRVEFLRIVRPEDTVTVLGEKIAFRMRGLKSRVSMMLEDGSVVCSGILTGKGVDSPA